MLRLFGTIEAGDGTGPPLPVSAPRLRMVLAILSAHLGERVSTDRLIDAMWGDTPPKSAGAALQVYVSKIRRLFEPDLAAGAASAFLRSDAGAYVLELPTGAVDIAEFTRICGGQSFDERELVDALKLWRGDPFGEFADEPWALTRTTEIRQLRLRSVQRRYGAAISAGRDSDIIDALRTDVAAHPFEERLVGLLMTAQYRLGDQQGALATYAVTRELLLDELGLDPTPELQQLQLLVLRHDATLLEGMRLRPATTPEVSRARPAMFGRHNDLARVEEAVVAHRLVTIVGPGGVGKTRLAQELSDRHLGCTMIDLSSSNNVTEALAQIATTLDVEGEPLTATATSVGLALEATCEIVVLDNCEHLLPGLGSTIADVLASSSSIGIIATSRQSIGLSHEMVIRLEPLVADGRDDAEAGTGDSRGLDRIAELPGVRILSARSGIAVTPDNAADMLALVRRLDGLPLALELAAFRLRALGAVDLDIADVDQSGPAPIDTPQRHRSLDTVLASSIERLTEVQVHVLETMSTFSGAVPLEAIVRLLGTDTSPVEARISVAELVDRSLVSVQPTTRGPRYRLLETVRSHCRARCSHDVTEANRARLVEVLRDVATERPGSVPAVLMLGDLDDEVSAALNHLEAAHDDATTHLSLLTPVATSWYTTGRVREARLRLGTALAAYPDAAPPLVGLTSALLGMISFGDGAFNDLAEHTATALAILEPMGFPGLGFVRAGHHVGSGELDAARAAIASFLDDPIAVGRQRLAGLEVASTSAWFADDLDGAAEHYRTQARLAVVEGDPGVESHALRGESMMVALGGDPQRGLDLCRRAGELEPGRAANRARVEHLAAGAVIRYELGDHATSVVGGTAVLHSCVRQFDATAATLTLPIVASGALERGDVESVARLTGWFDALCRSTGLYGPQTSKRLFDRIVDEAELAVDAEAWTRLRADGASLGLGKTLALVEPSAT